jgi:hypothetical protein
MPECHYLVPDQSEGAEKDIANSVSANDIDDAEDLFVKAKERLWNVNGWEKCCDHLNLLFSLADNHGQKVNRRARKTDHIKISKAGTASTEADVYDWVIIEAIEYDDYPDHNVETFAIHLRPTENPQILITEPATYYKGATSTLVIERDHKILKAWYHGRNEFVPTEESTNEPDGACSAWLGLSAEQWECLLKGFVGI